MDPEVADRLRSVTPDLPDEPTEEQVDAWIELAELVSDADFRALIRRMSSSPASGVTPSGEAARTTASLVVARVDTSLDPASPAAQPIVDELVGAYATATELLSTLEQFDDPRPERYWQLMATINGWPAFPSAKPAFSWLTAALCAQLT